MNYRDWKAQHGIRTNFIVGAAATRQEYISELHGVGIGIVCLIAQALVIAALGIAQGLGAVILIFFAMSPLIIAVVGETIDSIGRAIELRREWKAAMRGSAEFLSRHKNSYLY